MDGDGDVKVNGGHNTANDLQNVIQNVMKKLIDKLMNFDLVAAHAYAMHACNTSAGQYERV